MPAAASATKQPLLTKAQTSPAVVTGSSAASNDNKTKRTPKKLALQIRGLLTGKSRAERQKERAAAGVKAGVKAVVASAAAGTLTPTPPLEADDQSTVYGVNVDEATAAGEAAARAPLLSALTTAAAASRDKDDAAAPPQAITLLKVVLLLMDATTRRFELLQLEFDTPGATVADVLSQIPVAVTEDCLQAQDYRGVTGADGQRHAPLVLLRDVCTSNSNISSSASTAGGSANVMVAIADGMTSAECVKLARPILSDPKVMAMVRVCVCALCLCVRSCDFDANGVPRLCVLFCVFLATKV
jgi:hypothetical protein